MDVLSQTLIPVIDITHYRKENIRKASASLFNISQSFFNPYSQVTFT